MTRARIAIIGFSGRNLSDQQMVRSEHFSCMCDTILVYITNEINPIKNKQLLEDIATRQQIL